MSHPHLSVSTIGDISAVRGQVDIGPGRELYVYRKFDTEGRKKVVRYAFSAPRALVFNVMLMMSFISSVSAGRFRINARSLGKPLPVRSQ